MRALQTVTVGVLTLLHPGCQPVFAGHITFTGELHADTADSATVAATAAQATKALQADIITGAQSNKIESAVSHIEDQAIHLTPEQVERIANAITSAPPQTVTSVNSKTGAVVITAADVGAATLVQATNVAEAVVAAAAPTLAVASAATVTGPQSNLIATAWQNPASVANWTWTSNGKEITLTGYSGPAAVVMPDMLDGLPVTGFGTIFAGDQNITSVSGGQFITEIGNSAFEYSSLATANFPQATTIGDYAFAGTPLTTANFPQATTIGDYAFAGTPLTTTNLPQAVTIGDYAFSGTSLTTANFPQVTTIGDYAFSGTPLTTANFPQVTTIGDGAFSGTPLTTVNFLQVVTIGDFAFDSTSLITANFPQVVTIGDYAFEYSSLTSLYLGQNAPAEATDVFFETPNVTVYVTDPTATGYGATWNGRPVVRMPLFADKLTLKGTNIEDRITAKIDAATAAADTKYVAKAGFPTGGCKDLGTATNLVIDGTSIYYTAAPASAYTITVSQPVSSGYTYCLTTYSDSPITLVNADLRNAWVLGGTNTLVFYPGTTNRWLVKGSAP